MESGPRLLVESLIRRDGAINRPNFGPLHIVRLHQMIRSLPVLIFLLVLAPASDYAASRETAWTAKDISVVQTIPGDSGSENSRLEIGTGGDARITFDFRHGGSSTKGTIILVSGRWMLTQGFDPGPGVEIDEMDIAALNSQLVMRLLEASLPKGPPAPGSPIAISASEGASPIQVATSSASGEYGPPWKVSGTVGVSAVGAPATYKLRFTFTDEGHSRTMNLVGTVGATSASLPDSLPLSGWAVHRLGPYQQQSPNGTTLDYGAKPQTSTADTLGDLRKKQ